MTPDGSYEASPGHAEGFEVTTYEPYAAAREHLLLSLDLAAFDKAGFDADGVVDAILDALAEVHDEIEGAVLQTGRRSQVTLHTADQVTEWLYRLMKNRSA